MEDNTLARLPTWYTPKQITHRRVHALLVVTYIPAMSSQVFRKHASRFSHTVSLVKQCEKTYQGETNSPGGTMTSTEHGH